MLMMADIHELNSEVSDTISNTSFMSRHSGKDEADEDMAGHESLVKRVMGNMFTNAHKFAKGVTMDTLLRWRLARWVARNKLFAKNVEKGGKALDIICKLHP